MATEGDLRQARRLAEELGWTLERRTKHSWRYRRGDQTAGLPTSPGDHRSIRNFISDIRRAPR